MFYQVYQLRQFVFHEPLHSPRYHTASLFVNLLSDYHRKIIQRVFVMKKLAHVLAAVPLFITAVFAHATDKYAPQGNALADAV
jgi:hypothetical protein